MNIEPIHLGINHDTDQVLRFVPLPSTRDSESIGTTGTKRESYSRKTRRLSLSSFAALSRMGPSFN